MEQLSWQTSSAWMHVVRATQEQLPTTPWMGEVERRLEPKPSRWQLRFLGSGFELVKQHSKEGPTLGIGHCAIGIKCNVLIRYVKVQLDTPKWAVAGR